MPSIRLADLARQLDAKLYGDGNIAISGIASIKSAITGQITFLSNSRYREKLADIQASAIILSETDLKLCKIAALVVKNPYLSYAYAAKLLDTTPQPPHVIASSAIIHNTAKIGKKVSIGAHAIIESGVVLENNVSIGAGCFIGKKTYINYGSRLWPNVTIYHKIHIGKYCLIQSGSVIGSDGFGYASDNYGKWIKIPQLGTVIIGDNVEIGSCTTIDRGSLDNTIIGNGVIIDNQCHIAHNVIIGDHTAIAGGVIMAGGLKIGRYCMIGGASVMNGHIAICDKVTITGMSMVMRSITKPGVYSSGIPLQPNKKWRKTAILLMNINDIQQRLKAIERKISKQD